MSAWRAARRSWRATLFVHGCGALLAGAIALPVVGAVPDPAVSVQPWVAQWIAVFQLGESLRAGARFALAPALMLAVLSPWLVLTWLSALDRDAPLAVHSRRALEGYLAAAGVMLFGLGYLALVAALSGAGAYALGAFGSGLPAWLRAALGLTGVCAAAATALHALTLEDAAYAALSRGARGAAALRVGLRAVRPRQLGLRALLVVAQAALIVLAWGVPRLGLPPSWGSGLAVAVATQAAMLATTFARAVWLAWLVRAVDAERRVRAEGAPNG